MKKRDKYLNLLWNGLLIVVGIGILLSFCGIFLKQNLIYYTGLILVSPLIIYVLLMIVMLMLVPFALIFHGIRWLIKNAIMKYTKSIEKCN
jgi:hypothetical protein